MTTAVRLDTAVNSGLDGTDPNAPAFALALPLTALPSISTYETNGAARYNSATALIFTQPTTNYYTALLATVVNSTGSTLTNLDFQYDLVALGSGAEEVPGHRVYFSTTGATGSWVNLPAFNGATTSQTLGTSVTGLNWVSGSSVYVLFADDNAGAVADYTLGIDNVRWTGTAVPEPTVAMLGGLGILVGLQRRRRQS